MKNHWISFRLADKSIGGRDYDARYDDLVEFITNNTNRWWAETSAFFVTESDMGTLEFAKDLKSLIEPSEDLVVIRRLDKKIGYVIGDNSDQNIYKIAPYMKKL